MTRRPCMVCGQPSEQTRCRECTAEHHRTRDRGTARQRGYDTTWDRLSVRARRLQPWCTDCSAVEHLTLDHLPSAWQRRAEGKVIRLRDIAVVCGDCNNRRGSSRATGDRARDAVSGPAGEAEFASHTPGGYL